MRKGKQGAGLWAAGARTCRSRQINQSRQGRSRRAVAKRPAIRDSGERAALFQSPLIHAQRVRTAAGTLAREPQRERPRSVHAEHLPASRVLPASALLMTRAGRGILQLRSRALNRVLIIIASLRRRGFPKTSRGIVAGARDDY